MPETAQVTPAVVPAPQSASPSQTDAPASPAPPGPAEGKQSTAQDQKPPEDKRVYAEIARAKRLAAKAQADREAAQRLTSENKAATEKAARYDYLEKLQREDPYKFAKETGIDVVNLSKRHLEAVTGQGKSNAELVKEEVDLQLAERAKKQQEAAKLAADDEAEKVRTRTIEGARKQIQTLLASDKTRFELIGHNPNQAVSDAWWLIEQQYAKDKTILDFAKALDVCEAVEEEKESKRLDGSKVKSLLQKRAEAAKAAPPQNLNQSTKSRLVDQRPVVETQKPSPTVNPPIRRRARPYDALDEARKLIAENQAKLDN